MSTEKKVSDVVVEFLESKGVTHVFTVSGGGCMHLIDSLGRARNLTYVCNHHEQASAIAAESYARLKDGVGACVVTTGPGGTNALTGVLGAWLDSIPVVFISGQVGLTQVSRGTGCRQIGDQEFDIASTVQTMTKYATMITDKESVLFELEKAYHIATTGRPGPVWIDLPLDVQGAYVDVDSIPHFSPECVQFKLTDEDRQRLTSLITSARKPLFVVGNGIRISKSYDLFDSILKATRIPVVTSVYSGVDGVDNTYEFYSGRIGMLGQLTSNQIVQQADLLIVLGSRLNVKMTGYNTGGFAPNAKKIIVDVDRHEIDKHQFRVDLKIVGDLNSFLAEFPLMDELEIDEWRTTVRNLRAEHKYFYPKHVRLKDYASAYVFVDELRHYAGTRTIVTANGSASVVPLQAYRLNKGQRLFTNAGCGSMGYGLPAAIGAAFVDTTRDIICIEGDGSLQMNLQELQTLVHHRLPVKLFVINNDGYLSIKITQQSFFEGNETAAGRSSGVTMPNLEKICGAFGLPYRRISTNADYKMVLPWVLAQPGPVVCELFTHPYEKHEPKVGHRGVDSSGRIIPGELTDMQVEEGFFSPVDG